MAVSRRDVLRFGAWAAGGLGVSMALPRAARSAADEPIGLALCIALDYTTIDHSAYAGCHVPVLEGCLPDAKVMSEIALSRSFKVRKLINRDATTKNVKESITRAAKGKDGTGGLIKGDTLLISYSGHGTQVPDDNRDERDDNQDEAWCLNDGLLIDDELGELWTLFEAGVRIVVVSDSCHSGTMLKNIIMQKQKVELQKAAERHTTRVATKTRDVQPKKTAREVKEKLGTRLDHFADPETHMKTPEKAFEHPAVNRALPNEIRDAIVEMHGERYAAIQKSLMGEKKAADNTNAHVQLLSACRDEQTAADIITNGLFTSVLEEVWEVKQGQDVNYGTFLNKIAAIVQRDQIDQTPGRIFVGERNTAFENEHPFTCKTS